MHDTHMWWQNLYHIIWCKFGSKPTSLFIVPLKWSAPSNFLFVNFQDIVAPKKLSPPYNINKFALHKHFPFNISSHPNDYNYIPTTPLTL